MMLRSNIAALFKRDPHKIWQDGIPEELKFWDEWFRTKGLEWSETYPLRWDPNRPLQDRVAALLPERKEIHILDVGAGPLTILGKKCPGKDVAITPIDPLAEGYAAMMVKYGVSPLVPTQKLDGNGLRSNSPLTLSTLPLRATA